MKTIILNKKYVFKPEDNKTNFDIPFDVEKEFDALEIITEYSPKEIQDVEYSKKLIEQAIEKYVSPQEKAKGVDWQKYMPLLNHLTLSLDYKNEYIGCAHRHPNEQKHIISSQFSSPGFLKHEIQKGVWKAVVNLHHIAGGNVDYHIKISGIEGEVL